MSKEDFETQVVALRYQTGDTWRRDKVEERGEQMAAVTITDIDYKAMQQEVEIVACALLAMNPETLAAFIERADRAQSLGPILHPSEFHAAGALLSQMLVHARAIQTARKAIAETLP